MHRGFGLPARLLGTVAVDVGPGPLHWSPSRGGHGQGAGPGSSAPAEYAVGSLDVLAAAAAGRALADGLGRVETVVPVVNARRGEVFAAAYNLERDGLAPAETSSEPEDPDGGRFVDLAPAVDDRPAALSPEHLVRWLSSLAHGPGSVLVVGDGALRYLRELSDDTALDLGWAASLAAPPPVVLARLAVARLAAGATAAAPAEIVPDYRRPADARINWEQRPERTERPESSGVPDTATPTGGGGNR